MTCVGVVLQKSTKMRKIYYTHIYLICKSGRLDKISVTSKFEMPLIKWYFLRSKLSEISVVYWDYLLNWIDFQFEIGDDIRLIGGIRTTKAKYLILLYFWESGFD